MIMETNEACKDREPIEAVLEILNRQAPLTVKQEKFCSDACVERFLKAKGNSVKKAAKLLRTVLSWRESIGTEHLIADEFAAELADGVAYVAGHDDEARPVMVFRMKQDYSKLHSQKSFVRLLVFTLEVAIQSMSRFVDQFVLLFDTSLFRSASSFLNLFMGALKIISDYYPGRLHKAFVVDPPSPIFSYLWKGVRPFVELWTATAVVSTADFEDDAAFASYPMRAASLRFDPDITAASLVGSTSSRFSFTVSRKFDSLKPWYLTTTPRADVPTASPSLVGASPLSVRSFSFASPGARSTPSRCGAAGIGDAVRSIPTTPWAAAAPTPSKVLRRQQPPRTPRSSFLQSPAMLLFFGRKVEGKSRRVDREQEAFLPFLRFYRWPYDEMAYRSKMRPPLGGLISIVSESRFKQQQLRRSAANFHLQQRLR